ncbi:MAG: hypothetical protein NXI29_05530 [bacterium]|nr:hypothetical protein [bacterium]
MATFKDSQNRTWGIDLTVGNAMKVKADTGVDLVAALSDIGAAYKVIGALEQNLIAFCQAFFILTGAAEKGCSLADFASGMNGDVVSEAFEALDTEFTNFYPPEKREKIRQAKLRIQESLSDGQDQIIEELNSRLPQFREKMRVKIQQSMTQLTSGD